MIWYMHVLYILYEIHVLYFVSSIQQEDQLHVSADSDVRMDSEFFDQTSLLSSLHVNEEEEDGHDHQVKDLYVVVSDPEKHVGGYVSYNINTKVKTVYLIEVQMHLTL